MKDEIKDTWIKNNKIYPIIWVASCIIAMALGIQLVILNIINNQNFDTTSLLLLDRIVNIIENNEQNEKALVDSLQEDYVIRAKTVAYIIDAKPEAEYDVKELNKIASLVSVDEIHLFNQKGFLYSGTIPKYWGYSFDSGEQLTFFKPMLEDKSLTLCQDLMPNTSDEKKMMYAMTWDETGTRLVEVGIAPVRLLDELKQNEVSEVVARMPIYEGMQIFVANRDTGEIYGATDKEKIGKKLDDIGIARKDDPNELHKGTAYIDGENHKVSFRFSGPYTIGVAWSAAATNQNNAMALTLVGGYLGLAALIIIYMLVKMLKARQERDNQFGILLSMSKVYQSMHLIDLKEDTYVDYSAYTQFSKKRNIMPGAARWLYRFMNQQTSDEDKVMVRQFVELSTVAKRIHSKKSISLDYMTANGLWFRVSFVVIRRYSSGDLSTLLLITRNIDSEKRKEESLLYASHTDELTQCRNRRAYLEDVQTTLAMHMPFVYVAMDVNGLKQVNDTIGHEGGDELLKGAASCMKQCFGSYGKVYRMGGDEFAAILIIDKDRLKNVQRDFKETINRWTGQLVSTLHVACGYVYSQDVSWTSMEDIERIGDQRMYAEKEAYYSQAENNRRKR
ncbi:GGDEF domain-containing protein [Acidaminococcus sp.]|uniref:sensor domain-containing diguanylate cyclase n=1 Tax=Acidaminococcus sp. TaxID=1872103 RepID=UPI003D7E32D0